MEAPWCMTDNKELIACFMKVPQVDVYRLLCNRKKSFFTMTIELHLIIRGEQSITRIYSSFNYGACRIRQWMSESCVLLDRRRESVSVVQDKGKGPSLAGVALAHLVGHSLGMGDDAEDTDHTCRCHTATCVMSRHFKLVSRPQREL